MSRSVCGSLAMLGAACLASSGCGKPMTAADAYRQWAHPPKNRHLIDIARDIASDNVLKGQSKASVVRGLGPKYLDVRKREIEYSTGCSGDPCFVLTLKLTADGSKVESADWVPI